MQSHCIASVVAAASTLPSKCQRQRQANILSPRPVSASSTFVSKCRTQRRAHTLRPSEPPPRTVEQLQACSISVGASWRLCCRTQPHCRCLSGGNDKHSPNPSAAGRDEHAPCVCTSTTHRRAAASVLHQCRSFVAALLRPTITLQVPQWWRRQALSQSECRRQRRARTLSHSAPSPRTVEQLQACSISVGASW